VPGDGGQRGPDAKQEGAGASLERGDGPGSDRPGAGSGRTVLRAFAIVSQLGLTVAAGAVAGALAGYGLDGWLGTSPAFVIVGLLVGIAGGAMAAYRTVMEFLREK